MAEEMVELLKSRLTTKIKLHFKLLFWEFHIWLLCYIISSPLFLSSSQPSGGLEHHPRMESWEGSSECVWEHLKKTRILWSQFLQNTELFLESVFLLLGIADRSEFTSEYSLLLTVVIQINVLTILYMPLWKNIFGSEVACPWDYD